MKDLIIKLFSAFVGAGLVIGGIWKFRGRVKDVFRQLRGAGDSQERPGAPQRPPGPDLEPRLKTPPVPDLEPRVKTPPPKEAQPPCLLLTCFEQQQPLFLEALNIADPGDTAFESLVCLQTEGRTVYLTPALLDRQASLTWSVLRMAAGAEAEAHDAVPILNPPDSETAPLSPKDVERLRLAATTFYFGIDLAMIPLAEEVRTDIRTTLEQLQEILGQRLCLLEIHKDVVDDWSSAQRERRWDIWTDIFNGLDIRKEAPHVKNRKSGTH